MAPDRSDLRRDDTEADLIRRANLKDATAIRTIIQANNRCLYRLARSIVRDDQEAEDVLQEAYFRAFSSLTDFRQDSKLSTWLTRIVLNEALQRKRRRVEMPASEVLQRELPSAEVIPFPLSGQQAVDPERAMAQSEICKLLERAIDNLPDEFRTVLIARTLEGLSVEETAELLDLRPETVKTRLHRARAHLKAGLAEHIEPFFTDVFPFDGQRCEKLTAAVLEKIARAGT